ncbi:MAG: type II secretion system minor pseudopilin GspH [Gammaproteobacteria bacterium]
MDRSTVRGFTLVEILVVLVIISIVTAIGVLSLGALGQSPQAGNAAQKLAAIANLVSQQAVMRGEQYGLRVSPHSYEFLSYDGSKWSPVTNDDLLRARQLDAGVTLALELQGAAIRLPVATTSSSSALTADDNSGQTQLRPQILLLSSGEITPFKITVSGTRGKQSYVVSGDLQNGIRVLAPDDTRAG